MSSTQNTNTTDFDDLIRLNAFIDKIIHKTASGAKRIWRRAKHALTQRNAPSITGLEGKISEDRNSLSESSYKNESETGKRGQE
ncbi:hypothetical protein HWV62_26023 [Athelia sp. TMB]|nr:hypothetical protein HWV62_26023 [Athelia sp. TMB]